MINWQDADDNEVIRSYLVDDRSGKILAYVTYSYPHPNKWCWRNFDGKPARGPFDTEAAAKLAALLLYNE